jgi:hypothetical protein
MFKRVIITQVCTENTLLKVFERLKISLMKKKIAMRSINTETMKM